ncbi:telomere-protecting terminal protein Tpg [Streptomyces pilosus]|nr:CbrC family protein [Streptomyces pilosus]
MDDQQHARASALLRHKLFYGLGRAERALFTSPAPKSAQAQMKFLLTRAMGSTKAVAERLGVSRRTVERYRSGAAKKPQKRLQEALVQETESQWQPQVRAQARQRASTSAGVIISCRAYFGFGPEGTSDEGRVRQDPHWLVHCQDAAAFVGEVGYTELAAHPEALDQLRADMRLDGWRDGNQLEHFLTHLGDGASAMLFRCTVCGAHLAYVDASRSRLLGRAVGSRRGRRHCW